MAKGIRTCKVCGKDYEYCNTITNDRFRWQDVACCKEHATEYFALVAAARAGEQASVDVNNEQEPALDVPDAERVEVEDEDEAVTKVRSSKRKRQ